MTLRPFLTRRSALLPLALALVLMASCAGSPTHVRRYDFPPGEGQTYVQIEQLSPDTQLRLRVLGDVGDVMTGVVPPGAEIFRDTSPGLMGFGIGSPVGLDGMGELMVLRGMAHARDTDRAQPTYQRLVSGPRFVTTASVLFPAGTEPNLRVTHVGRPSRPTTLGHLYRAIHDGAGGRPFVVAGVIEFDRARTLALSHPPIHGEPLFENLNRYFAFGPREARGVTGIVMGIAADFHLMPDAGLREGLARVLHHDMEESSEQVASETRMLTVEGQVRDWARVRPGQIQGVDRLLADSTIRRAWLDVYVVGGIE